MKIFNESRLEFSFNNEWTHLTKYDEETDYRKIENAIEKTKAVDFIGILNNQTLSIIEVKNFKGSRIENKPRVESGENSLELEMAQKVRDTLAGIIGGARNSTHKQEDWAVYLKFLTNPNKNIHVVLWLEEDTSIHPAAIANKRLKAKGGTMVKRLREKLHWLTPHVMVLSIIDNNYASTLEVKYMPV